LACILKVEIDPIDVYEALTHTVSDTTLTQHVYYLI
jgi:hypothetical protein